jgi:hypothetical protein
MHAMHVIFFLRIARAGKKVTGWRLSRGGASCENKPMSKFEALAGRNQPVNDNDDSAEDRPVTIITGRVWKRKGGKAEGVHVMLVAPDDDSAVRRALESLAAQGYAEAELDQIGDMEGEPDEEPHLSAWQGALEGEVSIVTFEAPV